MTKRERAQVVELLRCAADAIVRMSWTPGGHAAWHLGSDDFTCAAAETAMRTVQPDLGEDVDRDEFLYCALEAAARVEEGSWP